ncbi:hypothetical protein GLOTRDRAFT_135912 [Gloeophyllum trabeum ATCC 11539]|uniref:SAP18-domain-containing protein n=1 Tax=Gloeophyllum trabeum (strain ATCC 11539 / FP-39264 / Madison 617) TaxID=670483 RepID=S7RZM1_GLOTA|nr:uncharacterized protein GLOTRDRAFT_135912 [Gloeophyllum trabeum ATCC 11539]EPQ58899.1 hypothetical protein GLOTRDRAFT_135912 [Gloeophyllum trabeum ATCC 11539]
MEDTVTPAGRPIVDREKTAPFLIRTFIKIGSFHRLNVFEDGALPTTDEQQIYTWKDATLGEVLTTLRNTAPQTPEYRHPLARYSFRAVYADSASRGRFAQKDLGIVYSRDILGEPGSLDHPAPRLTEDARAELSDREKEERTLDELRFVPGDYMCVAVILPKNVTVPGAGGELAVKGAGAAAAAAANGWKGAGGAGRGGDAGWGGSLAPVGAGRGGGHWRGESNGPPARGGRGGGRGDFANRDREYEGPRDRRPPPPRRGESPPAYRGRGRGRRSRSRSRSPPPHRRR